MFSHTFVYQMEEFTTVETKFTFSCLQCCLQNFLYCFLLLAILCCSAYQRVHSFTHNIICMISILYEFSMFSLAMDQSPSGPGGWPLPWAQIPYASLPGSPSRCSNIMSWLYHWTPNIDLILNWTLFPVIFTLCLLVLHWKRTESMTPKYAT